MWDDYARWKAEKKPVGEIMAINDIGQFLHEPVRHFATLHPEYMAGWRYYRERHLYGAGYSIDYHSHRHETGVSQIWDIENKGGSSGLFGPLIGLMMGYDPIVLCGIPMDNTGHFFDPPGMTHSLGDKANALVWTEMRDTVFDGRVKSMSGRTREWLGAP